MAIKSFSSNDSKQAELSTLMKDIESLKGLTNFMPFGYQRSAASLCDNIQKTVLNYAHEISKLTNDKTEYEKGFDSFIFAIMGTDAKADIIDSVDIERMTQAAIKVISNLASKAKESQRVAEAFQKASDNTSFTYIQKIHRLKILPDFYQSVVNGKKKAEVRINDRNFKVSDILILEEWSVDSGYSGNNFHAVITDITNLEHIADFPYGDWVMLSIAPVFKRAYDSSFIGFVEGV